MSHAKVIGRLGMLAVGLGIGAAMAALPGIAAADSNALDAAAFDPSALIADPAPAISGLNLAISVDGVSLFQSGTASASSGTDDIAIAYGSGSYADAGGTSEPGTGDYAFADGTDSSAYAGSGIADTAQAFGSGSFAGSGSGNGDTAYADGAGTTAESGGTQTGGVVDIAGNNDYASAVGTNDVADASALVNGMYGSSSGDIATIIGNSSDAFSGAGSYDFAGVLADSLTSTATGSNFLFDLMPSL
jgi:hypothetical protein